MKPEQDYTVSEFMNKDLIEVRPDTTVKEAADVMAAERVSSTLVIENKALLGIVTEKDLARKIVAKGLDANKVLVKDIMSTEVITIDPSDSLYDAMLKFNSKKIKHLPVVSNNVVMSLITVMDIMRVQPAYMELLAQGSVESA